MRKLSVALTAALAACLMMPALTRPTTALTSAEGVDGVNAFPNVGSIMVWRDQNNPIGLPGGLAGQVTVVLIHPKTLLTAGHFAARAESFGTLPALASNRRQLRSKCLGSAHMDRPQSPRHLHRSPFFPEALHPTELPVRRHRRTVRTGDQRRRHLLSRRARARHPTS